MLSDLPNISASHLETPQLEKLTPATASTHPPRILLLYGSLRATSYSRLLTLEAERILRHFGADTRIFDPHGLPLADSVRQIIRKSSNCANCRSGPRGRYGAAQSVTAI
ncbi:hypothetical protein PPGU19_074580 (plasmid) [Paraburkholderia sp. PGU19]|nr:hypothetical protein PPGU19_074580 [Paraburkholderia sp. PGU19]